MSIKHCVALGMALSLSAGVANAQKRQILRAHFAHRRDQRCERA